MAGQDVVYANLSGVVARQARSIVGAMQATGVKRLIFISSMGIYGEVPGQAYGSIPDPQLDRLEENVAACDVVLTADDQDRIRRDLSLIEVQGERRPEAVLKMTGL